MHVYLADASVVHRAYLARLSTPDEFPNQVKVMMTNARNVQLHVSFNGMGNSECDVELDTIFNSSVHLSFQVWILHFVFFSNFSSYRTPRTPRSP